MVATPIEELAQRTEEEVRAHLAVGQAGRGPAAHVAASTCKGIRRILTVSADTELVSAPAYLRAAQHAPALNNFGSAMSIVQDELAHAHIGYRLLGDLGVDMDWLMYERPAGEFKYPYAFDVPAELVDRARVRERALRPGRLHAARRRPRVEHVRAMEARAREGRQGGDVPPAPRAHVAEEAQSRTRSAKAEVQAAVDWMFILTLEWFGLPDDRKRHGIQLEYGFKGQSNDELRQAGWPRWCRSWRRSACEVPAHRDRTTDTYVIDCPFPRASTRRSGNGCSTRARSRWDEVITRWKGRGPMNHDYVRTLQRGYRTTGLRRAA